LGSSENRGKGHGRVTGGVIHSRTEGGKKKLWEKAPILEGRRGESNCQNSLTTKKKEKTKHCRGQGRRGSI